MKTLRKVVIDWLPEFVPAQFCTKPFDRKVTTKAIRGFTNPATGWLLCPREKLNEFETDPEKYGIEFLPSISLIFTLYRFNIDVANGNILIKANQWPNFLYPLDDTWDITDPLDNITRGEYLVAVRP